MTSNPKYFITPGEGGKMYVLRVKGYRNYGMRSFPYDQLVKVLGTDIEEAKQKATEYLGNSDFVVNDVPLKAIVRGKKDPDKAWKWQFGQFKGADIREQNWDDARVQSYATWFWNSNKVTRKEKDEDFFQKVQTILKEKGLIVEDGGEWLTKKDYDYKKKKEGWRAEAAAQGAKSEYLGNKGDKMRRKLKFVFSTQAGMTQWGTFNVTKFVDEEGNTLTLKGPYPPFTDKTDFHDCVFTIKDYSDFRNEKQTIITRMKVLDLPKEETEETQNTQTEDFYSDRTNIDYSREEYSAAPVDESFYPKFNNFMEKLVKESLDQKNINSDINFIDLQKEMKGVANQYETELSIEEDEGNDGCWSIGFSVGQTGVYVSYDPNDNENPYFVSCGDPEIPTANETFCENLEECMSVVRSLAEGYSESGYRCPTCGERLDSLGHCEVNNCDDEEDERGEDDDEYEHSEDDE